MKSLKKECFLGECDEEKYRYPIINLDIGYVCNLCGREWNHECFCAKTLEEKATIDEDRLDHEKMSDREMPTMKKDAFGHDDLNEYAQDLVKFCIDEMFSKIEETKKTPCTKERLKKIFLNDLKFWADERKMNL